MKIASIVGTRPQFIKIAPLIKALDKHNLEHRKLKIEHLVVHTGQHYDSEMSKVFFDDLEIPKPDYNLGVGSGNHGYQVGNTLIRLEEVLLKEKPDLALVYGDTNSTLAGALAAAKLHIPVGHIEAGLRSFNRKMPEEINRVLTDHISKFLFCPTKTAVNNLKKEGIKKGVYLVGDVMYDVFLKSQELLNKRKILSELKLKPREYLLLTIHRGENTNKHKNLKSILGVLATIKEKVVFPIHPRTKKTLKRNNIVIKHYSNFLLIDPVSYLDMLTLEKNAKKILTDSGGVQKEAYWFGVPCITLREETEWVETMGSGWNIIVGTNPGNIIKAIEEVKVGDYAHLPYGKGNAAMKIVDTLMATTSHTHI